MLSLDSVLKNLPSKWPKIHYLRQGNGHFGALKYAIFGQTYRGASWGLSIWKCLSHLSSLILGLVIAGIHPCALLGFQVPTTSRRNSTCLSDGYVHVLLVSGVLELQDMQNEQDVEQKVVKTHSR